MHEYSIVQALIDQCEEHAKRNGASKITKVVTKIGVLSGVEPDLLNIAFETFKEGTICEESEFVVNIQPIVIKCKQCNKTSTKKEPDLFCPFCGSIDSEVIDGEDMYLMSLEME